MYIRTSRDRYKISMILRIETPAKRPTVPPIADSFVSNVALWSFVILSNVGGEKKMLT